MSKSVIVTDGNYHNSLTIVRSLGKMGLSVIVGAKKRKFFSKFITASLSRYCSNIFFYADPNEDPDQFIKDINKAVIDYNVDIIFPVSVGPNLALARFRNELDSKIKIPFPDFQTIDDTHDKYILIKRAEKLGIPVPKTKLLFSASIDDHLKEYKFPLVIKTRKGAANNGVWIIRNREQFKKIYDDLSYVDDSKIGISNDSSNPMIQEYVDGKVHDACCLSVSGETKLVLTQVRLKTLPPEGGFGVYNQTTDIKAIQSSAIKLLNDIKWHGVAMVEFKYDTISKTYKLMEINTKFWGTLALSVHAGYDYPSYAYYLANNNLDFLKEVESYKVGHIYRWIFPNEMLHVLKSKNKIKSVLKFFLDFFKLSSYSISIRDPLPNFSPIFSLFDKILSRITK